MTDGLKLTDKAYLHSLLQTGLDHLLFILQPDNPASWQALETILPEDLYTTVHLTVTPWNVKKAGETLEKLAGLKVKRLSLGASEPSLHEALHALHNQAAGLCLTLRWDLPVPYGSMHPVAFELKNHEEPPKGAGKAWLYVEPDGDVLPTQGELTVLGNLLNDPWDKIWKNRPAA